MTVTSPVGGTAFVRNAANFENTQVPNDQIPEEARSPTSGRRVINGAKPPATSVAHHKKIKNKKAIVSDIIRYYVILRAFDVLWAKEARANAVRGRWEPVLPVSE